VDIERLTFIRPVSDQSPMSVFFINPKQTSYTHRKYNINFYGRRRKRKIDILSYELLLPDGQSVSALLLGTIRRS